MQTANSRGPRLMAAKKIWNILQALNLEVYLFIAKGSFGCCLSCHMKLER